MPLITKPDFTYVWASGGAVVAPNDTKKQLGWVAEAPPFQYDNWLQNRQDQMLAHINQRGIPAWDGLTNYEAGGLSYVQGSDGKVYKSVAASGPASVVSNPTTDGTDTYWTVAFADVGAFLTQAAGDTRYTQRSNNLSDVTNVATARTNLGAAPLASPAFTGTPTAPTASPGTNTTQLATTAFVQATIETKAVGIQYILVQDQKPSGTGGGTPAAANTFNVRTLNTTIANTITGATLATNQISLPAGTYRFRGACAASIAGFSKAYIYNVTDATYVAIGMGMNCSGPGQADPVTIYSSVSGRVVITSTKLFELRQFLNTNNTNGFGDPVSDGKNEMYAELEIIKEA